MARKIQAKYKLDRRLGINLWGRPKSAFNSRNYAPGEHGQDKSKLSDYCIQLRAKQKLRGYYGAIREKQFRNIFDEAARRRGDTSENLIGLLESRLDAVAYRLKFAITIFGARQLVSHGHVMVNGKIVNIPSYRVKPGDEIALVERLKDNVNVASSLSSSERDVPDYFEVESKGLKAKFLRVPKLSEVPYPVEMEPNLVTEFYSR